MAILDARTGDVRHQVRVEDLTGFEPETSPWVDESAHLLGRNVVLTTETHALRHGPRSPAPCCGPCRSDPIRTYSWRLPDGRIACADATSETADPPPRSSNRAPVGPVGVDRRGRRHRHADSSPPGRATNGAEASYLQRPRRPVATGRHGRSRRRLCRRGGRSSRAGARSRSRARRSWTSTTPGRWRSREPLEGHSGKVLGIELAGPALGLLWTAGQDGTAVAFDLTGTRGVLRTVDLDVAANVGSAAAETGRCSRSVYEIEPQHRAHPRSRRRGATSSASSQPFTDCVCQIGHTAITPDGRLALAGVFEWTDDFSEAITDRGRVVVWDTDTGRADAHHRHTLGARRAGRHARRGAGARQRLRRVGSLRHRLGRGDLEPRDRACRTAGSTASRCRAPPRRLPAGRRSGGDRDPPRPRVRRGAGLANSSPGSGTLTRVAFSADSRTMALGSDSGTAVLPRRRDAGAGRPRPAGHRGLRHRPPDEP